MSRRRFWLFALAATAATLAVVAVALRYGAEPPQTTPTMREVDVPADSYRVNPNNPRELEVGLMLGLGDEVLDSSATETASAVVVRIRVRQDLRVKAALGVPTTATVILRDPLDARVVMDVSGRRLQEQR